MSIGFIKLHRELLEWEWYDTPNMVQFMIHCLLRANHKKIIWKGRTVLAGQFISGRSKLALETGLSEKNIRTCISRLVTTGELAIKSGSRNTLFTVNSWEKYQSKILGGQQSANESPTEGQQGATNNNEKECKEGKNKELVIPFEEHFPESHKAEAFSNSWCEWIEHRKQKKSKVTESMAKKQLKFLGQFSVIESISSLENSMMNGYTGLFEPKQILKKESRDEELDRLIAEEYGK